MVTFPIRCFLAVGTGTASITLRRYNSDQKCDQHPWGYCQAIVEIGQEPVKRDARGVYQPLSRPTREDSRWPTACEACGRPIPTGEEHTWQINQDELYAPAEGNEGAGELPHLWTTDKLPVGAMYFPPYLQPTDEDDNSWRVCPTDGSVLVCITPDWHDGSGRGEWIIDAYASNCDRRDEKHHCWCRSGQAPWITVGKTPPDEFGTCGAGAGSIWMNMSNPKGGFHGFLRDGYLVRA